MTRERGTVTLWVLGLCVAVLFLGGLGLDLWRTVAVRRDLSAMADAAATAGANGLDESQLRAGSVHLDPVRARALARDELAQYNVRGVAVRIDIDDDVITVTLRAHVDFSLLGIFMRGDQFAVGARASARPELR